MKVITYLLALLTHSGANPGWYAYFQFSVDRWEGFVIASNSSRGGTVSDSVSKLWSRACREKHTTPEQR